MGRSNNRTESSRPVREEHNFLRAQRGAGGPRGVQIPLLVIVIRRSLALNKC
jgi:hypothetical protein